MGCQLLSFYYEFLGFELSQSLIPNLMLGLNLFRDFLLIRPTL